MGLVEINRDGEIRWNEIVYQPGTYERRSLDTGNKIADIIVTAPVIVHAQERWVSCNKKWTPVWCDWENARPAPTAWQRFKAWLTYPGQRCLPEATARNRWDGAIERFKVEVIR